MGAFAEEVDAEAQVEEVAEQAVATDEVDEQALVTGETKTATFYVLYIDSSFNLGYNWGSDKWPVDYICQYGTGHSGYNHSMLESIIKDQKATAEGYAGDGWEIVGWTKKVSANPSINSFKYYYRDTDTVAMGSTDYIYLVAKKTTPAPVEVTYTVNYVDTDGTTAAPSQTTKNTAGSATFTVNDVDEAIAAKHANENFVGWKDEATGTTYQPGANITVSDPTTVTLTAMWEAKAVEKTFTVNYYYEKDGQLFKADTKTGTGDSAAFKVISDVPAKDNWTFEGWVDANDVAYAAGLDFDLSASTSTAIATDTTVTLNLYATWTAETPPVETKTYTVNYVDEDGETVAADPESQESAAGYAEFIAKGQSDIYQAILDKHAGKVFGGWKDADGETYAAGADVTVRDPAQAITLIAIWTTSGGDEPTPPTPGEKVSEPGMIKTVKDAEGTDKTGEGAIGTRKPGDVIDFKLQTNVGEDMMWTKDENDKKVQRLTKDENGTWGGAEYVLTITDTMEGPMTADWTTLKVTLKGADITDADYVTATTSATGFTITIDCVAALNAGAITEEDIGVAEILVTYTATVDADAADKAELRNTATINNSSTIVSIVTGDVTNPPVTPPSTGGSGTRMFTIGGVLILAAACVLFVVSRKKAKD